MIAIAIMSVITDVLVFADLGHDFMDEMFGNSEDEKPLTKYSTKWPDKSRSSKTTNQSTNSPDQNIHPIDYFPDTYIPSRNTGHIPYYENPLLEPSEMFPTYYGDVDTDIVGMELRRIRDRQALEGSISKTPDHFKATYRSEFADEENKPWWGNTEF